MQIQAFQQNLKKTQLGVQFGKRLLTDPGSISPKQITGILNLLGAEIPREIAILPDAAQAIITGSAVIDRVNAGTSLLDMKEVVSPSLISIGTISRLFNEVGWMDDKTATQVAVLGNIAMIVASGGTNVYAWIQLAMQIGQEGERARAEAMAAAKQNAYWKIGVKKQQEIDQFMLNLQDFQAGKLGLFSFLAEGVDDFPLMFDNLITKNKSFEPLINKFPGLRFLPKGPWTFEGTGGTTTWWGENVSERTSVTIEGLSKMPMESAFDFIFKAMIGPGASSYMDARAYFLSQGKADIINLAVFALFDDTFRISQNSSVLESFIQQQITPYELGEKNVFDRSFSGTNYGILSNFGLTKKEEVIPKEIIQRLDQMGNLSPLINNRFTQDAMRQHFSFGAFPGESRFRGYDWRNLANFIAIMDAFDLVRNDPLYEKIYQSSPVISSWSAILPSVKQLQDHFARVQQVTMIRRVNTAALANVGYFLGVNDVTKLKSVKQIGGPTIFR